jgi:hypothetical protein
MKTLSHDDVQFLLLSGHRQLTASQRSELDRHLASCSQCGTFARQLRRLEPRLQYSLSVQWDSMPLPGDFTRRVLQKFGRRKMHNRFGSISRGLAWTGMLALIAVLLAWAIPVLVFNQPPYGLKLPQPLSRILAPALTASDMDLQPDDLGEDWTLVVQQTAFIPNTYWATDDEGLPFIGEHKNKSEPPFSPEELDSYSMHGFAHKDREVVIFSATVLFIDLATAQRFAEEAFPNVLNDSDIPEENLEIQIFEVGKDGTQIYLNSYVFNNEIQIASAGFHKNRVIFVFFVLNHKEGPIPLNQEQLLEIVRRVEARIPADN